MHEGGGHRRALVLEREVVGRRAGRQTAGRALPAADRARGACPLHHGSTCCDFGVGMGSIIRTGVQSDNRRRCGTGGNLQAALAP